MQTLRLATKEGEEEKSQVQDMSVPENELFQAKLSKSMSQNQDKANNTHTNRGTHTDTYRCAHKHIYTYTHK